MSGAFGSRLKPAHIVSAGVEAPPQDQCMFPVMDPTKRWKDSVTLSAWAPTGDVVDDGGTLAYVNAAGQLGQIASVATPLVLKSWTGALTILTRAWGISSGAGAYTMFGDLGDSGQRGSAAGPNGAGRGSWTVAANSSTIVTAPHVDGMFSSTPMYRDYAYTFDPSVRTAHYRDGVLMSELTSGIPAARYVGSSNSFVVGNRGDGGDSFVGRYRFVFVYKKILSLAEMDAAFNDPIYKPGA